MKKLIAALIVVLCLVWGCATLTPQNVRLAVDSVRIAYSIAMTTAVYLYDEGMLSRSEIRKITELDKKYRELNQIVRGAITTWEIASTISEKEGAEKKAALDEAIIKFTEVALELNNFIQELKNRKPGEVGEKEEV